LAICCAKTAGSPADAAVSVTAQVCSALAASHTAGIVHRDIKPGNVLVRADGRVKVTDFGIAQVQGQAGLTGAGLGLGTARYLSPEQACGQAVTSASDLYSAGVLLFQMLTGKLPFTGDSAVAVALSHVREKVPSVHDFAPEVPPPLAEVVATATAKDPQNRYADAAQMGAALRKALAAPHAATAASAPDLPAVPDLPTAPDLPAASEPPICLPCRSASRVRGGRSGCRVRGARSARRVRRARSFTPADGRSARAAHRRGRVVAGRRGGCWLVGVQRRTFA
jgi:serine/threonine protein kinase